MLEIDRVVGQPLACLTILQFIALVPGEGFRLSCDNLSERPPPVAELQHRHVEVRFRLLPKVARASGSSAE